MRASISITWRSSPTRPRSSNQVAADRSASSSGRHRGIPARARASRVRPLRETSRPRTAETGPSGSASTMSPRRPMPPRRGGRAPVTGTRNRARTWRPAPLRYRAWAPRLNRNRPTCSVAARLPPVRPSSSTTEPAGLGGGRRRGQAGEPAADHHDVDRTTAGRRVRLTGRDSCCHGGLLCAVTRDDAARAGVVTPNRSIPAEPDPTLGGCRSVGTAGPWPLSRSWAGP